MWRGSSTKNLLLYRMENRISLRARAVNSWRRTTWSSDRRMWSMVLSGIWVWLLFWIWRYWSPCPFRIHNSLINSRARLAMETCLRMPKQPTWPYRPNRSNFVAITKTSCYRYTFHFALCIWRYFSSKWSISQRNRWLLAHRTRRSAASCARAWQASLVLGPLLSLLAGNSRSYLHSESSQAKGNAWQASRNSVSLSNFLNLKSSYFLRKFRPWLCGLHDGYCKETAISASRTSTTTKTSRKSPKKSRAS